MVYDDENTPIFYAPQLFLRVKKLIYGAFLWGKQNLSYNLGYTLLYNTKNLYRGISIY